MSKDSLKCHYEMRNIVNLPLTCRDNRKMREDKSPAYTRTLSDSS